MILGKEFERFHGLITTPAWLCKPAFLVTYDTGLEGRSKIVLLTDARGDQCPFAFA